MDTISQMVERDFVHTLPRPPPCCKYFLYKSMISQGKSGVAKGSKATRLAIGWMCAYTSRWFESSPPLFHQIVGLVDGSPRGLWQAAGEGSIPSRSTDNGLASVGSTGQAQPRSPAKSHQD
jgi:hypothetical protein